MAQRSTTSAARLPTPEEVAVLDAISEQTAMPMDQLARFLKAEPREARKTTKELQRINCVEVQKFLEGDEPWVWLTHHGAQHTTTGFAAIKPPVNRLRHLRAINEARLIITKAAPGGEWICERMLKREEARERRGGGGALLGGHGRRRAMPDAEFRIENEHGKLECHAIEVEITPKSKERLVNVIAEHHLHYDAVVYLCSPEAARQLKRIEDEEEWSILIVRELPGTERRRGVAAQNGERPRRGEPRPEDIPILDLISEQGAIPVDQLAQFLDCKLDKAKRIAKRLYEAGLIRRERLLAGQPDWVWLSKRGARFSTTGLSAPRPKVGSLALMRAINGLRIAIAKDNSEIRWISRRILLREQGRNAAVPKAVVEIGDERHAIEVRLTSGPQAGLRDQIQQRVRDYDAAVYFCAPPALRQLKGLKEEYAWPNVVVRSLPHQG